jgi:hypothetical protein
MTKKIVFIARSMYLFFKRKMVCPHRGHRPGGGGGGEMSTGAMVGAVTGAGVGETTS